MGRPLIESLPTRQQAKVWARTAVEILFADGDPFMGEVPRRELKREIELAVLRKLVTHDTPDLTEAEFQTCVFEAARQD
jgi:hypothetical protein